MDHHVHRTPRLGTSVLISESWYYTPKHGSWLDMAEVELSVLSRQCLDRRIPNKPVLIEEVAAWEEDRNKDHTKADWQFTTAMHAPS